MASSTGTSQSMRSDSTWMSNAEPRSAPRIIASPVPKGSAPEAANPATSSATAAELCNTMAMTVPAPAAPSGWRAVVIRRRNEAP